MPGSDLDVDAGVYCAVHSSSSGRGIVRGFLVEQGSNSHAIQNHTVSITKTER